MSLLLEALAGPGDPERVACHEGGHTALAIRALGREVSFVTLEGRTILSRLAPPLDPLGCLRWKLAGPAAESLAFGVVHEYGARSDRADALREAWDLTGDLEDADALLDSEWHEVRDLLFDHWDAVERIALALLEGPGVLNAEQLAKVAERQ